MCNETTNSNPRFNELANLIQGWDGKDIHELKSLLDEFYELTGETYLSQIDLVYFPHREQVPEYLRGYDISYIATCDINGYCYNWETNSIEHARTIRAKEADYKKFITAQMLASMSR